MSNTAQPGVRQPVNDEILTSFFKVAINHLSSGEKLVLALKLYEGLELPQVAALLGWEEARVAANYQRAMSILQQLAERAILTDRLTALKTPHPGSA